MFDTDMQERLESYITGPQFATDITNLLIAKVTPSDWNSYCARTDEALKRVKQIERRLLRLGTSLTLTPRHLATIISFAGVDAETAIKQAREWANPAAKTRNIPTKSARNPHKKTSKKASRKH